MSRSTWLSTGAPPLRSLSLPPRSLSPVLATFRGRDIANDSVLLPDLADAATLFIELLTSYAAASYPVEKYEQMRADAAGLSTQERGFETAWLRGPVFSHRNWIEANNRRELHRPLAPVLRPVRSVVCPITPTPAFPHDHEPNLAERRIDIDGVESLLDQFVWPACDLPACPPRHTSGPSPDGLP